jgi:hypothetical protein
VGQLPLAMAAALPQPTIAFGETDQLLPRAIAKRTTAKVRDARSMPLRFTSAAAQLGQIAISRFLASTLLAALFISGLLALTGCERPSPPATLDSLGTPSALQPAEPRVNSEKIDPNIVRPPLAQAQLQRQVMRSANVGQPPPVANRAPPLPLPAAVTPKPVPVPAVRPPNTAAPGIRAPNPLGQPQ